MLRGLLDSFLARTAAIRSRDAQIRELTLQRDRLAAQLGASSPGPADSDRPGRPPGLATWDEEKRRKQVASAAFREAALGARLSPLITPLPRASDLSFAELVRHRMAAEPYWFQRLELLPGLYSPGWSDPASEKLPYYGLPEDLTGKRVLDIGCAEGFFSFEAERRGAREVIGIDSFPASIRRFQLVKAARQSNAEAFLMNVYDLDPDRLGTFDLVLFYGVFYHLKHPQLALERIRTVCRGELRFQTYMLEEPAVRGTPWARYFPHGMASGKSGEHFDPTIFWLFNSTCCLAMLDHVGFNDLEILSTDPHPFVVRARSPQQEPGVPPDQTRAPWS